MNDDDAPRRLSVDHRFSPLLVLEDFDDHLTPWHGVYLCSNPDTFEDVLRILGGRMRKKILARAAPTFRLHGRHVVLFQPPVEGKPGWKEALERWTENCGLSAASTFQCWWAVAESPFVEGFFKCLCLLGDGCSTPSEADGNGVIQWSGPTPDGRSATSILVEFVQEEVDRCKPMLGSRRYEMPRNRFLDPENAELEFAASVLSPSEMRIWSRARSYPD